MKDRRWDVWPAVNEEYFDNLGNSLTLRPEVPKEIAGQFDLIKSVLRFCYYDYELTSVVFLLLGIAFEAAIKIRYEQSEEYAASKKRKSLKSLIDWGISNDVFEEDPVSLHAFRKIRNIHAHQKKPVIFGITGMQSIGLVTDTINGIFDPRVELRRARVMRIVRINRIFDSVSQNGMILTWNNSRLIIFTARLLVFDNLRAPHEYHLAVWPIFKIDPQSNQVDEGNPIVIRCHTIRFRKKPERTILFSEGSTLSPIVNPKDYEKFNKWKGLYDSSKFPLKHVIHYKLAQMRHGLMSEYIYSPGDSHQ